MAVRVELTIEALQSSLGITDEQIESRLRPEAFYNLAAHFDNIDPYIDHLELTDAQKNDVRRETSKPNGTQLGICQALKYWHSKNPIKATYRALVCIVLTLGKGDVATHICEHLVQEVVRKSTTGKSDVENIQIEPATSIPSAPVSTKKSKPKKRFKLNLPPLSIAIREILERYPDGQIFKEMIQNADDAGAKTVWFYVDERDHSTSNLPDPKLAKFQGPALVAANDACFTDDDWEGIQRLMRSNKAKDPLKTGKFGIGFNSVYHITDIAMIVSGDQIAFTDPCARIWSDYSEGFDIEDMIEKHPEIILSINGLAGFDLTKVSRKGSFENTIFRLPLRATIDSEDRDEEIYLSTIVYDTNQLHKLLDALRKEAKFLLLFLKSVITIKIFHISKNGEHRLSFCIERKSDNNSSEQLQQCTVAEKVEDIWKSQGYEISEQVISSHFSVNVIDRTDSNDNQNSTSEWLAINLVGSSDPEVLKAAREQKVLPLIGTALELRKKSLGGRIFCCLPLPADISSSLPIHINGTFGLTDDRRSLKWPGLDMDNDSSADWNVLLINKLLPKCYVQMLLKAQQFIPKLLDIDQFHSTWPDPKNMHKQFMGIVDPFFALLLKEAVFWTDATNSWVPLCESQFIDPNMSETIANILHKILSRCKVNIVRVTTSIWGAIGSDLISMCVTPKIVSNNMRNISTSYSCLTPREKRELLEYFLSNDSVKELIDLRLVPLANSQFAELKNSNSEPIYLCTEHCSQFLLPTLEYKLVNQELQTSLSALVDTKDTNLKFLTVKCVSKLLPEILPTKVFISKSKVTIQWLHRFWNWLASEQNEENLNLFENTCIVPCLRANEDRDSKNILLMPMSKKQPVIYIDSSTYCPDSLLSVLCKMNIKVCLQSDFKYVRHNQLQSFMKYLNANDVLDSGVATKTDFNGLVFTPEEAASFRQLINYTPISDRSKATLKFISIFTSATNSASELHSVSGAAKNSVTNKALGEPRSAWIVKYLPQNFLLLSYDQLKLLQTLDVVFPTETQLLINHIFPLIKTYQFPDSLIDALMKVVIDKMSMFDPEANISEFIKSLPFIKLASGKRVTPQQVFDPSNTSVADIFKQEDVFPLDPFKTPQRLKILQECGLRTSVTPQEILNIIYSISCNTISQPQSVDIVRLWRANAILKYISDPQFQWPKHSEQYNVPDEEDRYSFSDALSYLSTQRCWLPVVSQKPSGYPEQLPWRGSDYSTHFVSLSDSVVITSKHSLNIPLLVGSRMFIVDAEQPLLHRISSFDTDPKAVMSHAIAQFQMIINGRFGLKPLNREIVANSFYTYMNDQDEANLLKLKLPNNWIYLKRNDQFVSPDMIILQPDPSFRENLEPFIYCLPDNLQKYQNLFTVPMGFSTTLTDKQFLLVLKMIGSTSQQETGLTSEVAWSIVISILKRLTPDSDIYSPPSGSTLCVPIENDSDWPQLENISNVIYTDNNFLREHLNLLEEYKAHTHRYLHNKIDTKLAHSLGAKPLSEFYDLSEDLFEDAGQHESIVVRLKNILTDYKDLDGLTIIKELLQNADDAKAKEVNICYDARQHETEQKKLFFHGMAEAHGPALIVHNDETFSDDDFKNITRLAAATKQNKASKIGRFGIGFCSVYHMTDVPSFVSRDQLFIFDPTLSFLEEDIKNENQPGKKVAFTNKFISKSDQLTPYDGLFGFNRSTYQGTMFRFPFRTRPSRLSDKCYTEDTIGEMVHKIQECASSLLLFLQHVKEVTIQRFDKDQTEPSVIKKITREDVSLESSLHIKAEIRSISCSNTSQKECNYKWLVSQQNEYNSEHYYTAAVACPLIEKFSSYVVDPNFKGEVFCFLPLSQRTGLPVHVHANFAVLSNRKGIWVSKNSDSSQDFEVNWNITLMESVVPKAYHLLLVALKDLMKSDQLRAYTFYSLWPVNGDLHQTNPWERMVNSFYKLLCAEDTLFYAEKVQKWLSIVDSKFCSADILSLNSEDNVKLNSIHLILQQLQFPVIDLPDKYRCLIKASIHIISEKDFLDIFFENLSMLETIHEHRNVIVEHILKLYAAESDDNTERSNSLFSYLDKYDCIPCTPDGKQLKKCKDVIKPQAFFASLFDSHEGYFPIKEISDKQIPLAALLKLGMISEKIPWSMLVERAKTVPGLYSKDKVAALARASLIITSKFHRKNKDDEALASTPFLPVIQTPPEDYPIDWKGSDCQLKSGLELIRAKSDHFDNILMCGSSALMVCEAQLEEGGCGPISEEMLTILGIQKLPSVKNVIDHLIEIVKYSKNQKKLLDTNLSWINKSCMNIYKFLNHMLQEEGREFKSKSNNTQTLIRDSLVSTPCIWTGKEFVKENLVVQECNFTGRYLHPLPDGLSSLPLLTAALKIKKEITLEDVQYVLQQMKNDFEDNPIDQDCQEMFLSLLPTLMKLNKESKLCSTVWFLPDNDYVMHLSSEMSYDDTQWISTNTKFVYVNKNIPGNLALKLGVKRKRGTILEHFIDPTFFQGIPFGQHEDMTQRINNILKDYPFDITVLKELLQNADDAKASKMFVILDKRTHGTEYILSDNWADLQGPALLVWNDSVFTENDLTGIQKLGLGSKRFDDETIGQHGIGFNVVYHLTDCPSFITGGDTLCVLDPHCRYVYGAKPEMPGKRYDNLIEKGFWKHFPDLKTAFLLDGLANAPDFSKGSLFRFPLRVTEKLAKASKILDHSLPSKMQVITTERMNRKLTAWSPSMKNALLFLNHVEELQFIVIEENSTFSTYLKYTASSKENRSALNSKISSLARNSEMTPKVVKYPLTITKITNQESKKEKWLVQQGIGDLDIDKQSSEKLKLRHGIAAPLKLPIPKPPDLNVNLPKPPDPKVNLPKPASFNGQVFCFLPLSLQSKLPVHVNGNFSLSTDRRNLWHSSAPNLKITWNKAVLHAIAASYANLLAHCKDEYVSREDYQSYNEALEAIHCYYDIFPTSVEPLDAHYGNITGDVYRSLVEHNSSVMGVIESVHKAKSKPFYCVNWYPIKSETPHEQVYFWRGQEEKLRIILECIGMKLTKAQKKVQEHLNSAMEDTAEKLQHITPSSVFKYYSRLTKEVNSTNFLCKLENTPFKSIENFKHFIKYLLVMQFSIKIYTFPETPFGLPLLLTADGVLREMNETQKVIRSEYSHLFQNSLHLFLHPKLIDVPFQNHLFVLLLNIEDTDVSDIPEFAMASKALRNELPVQLFDTHVCSDYEQYLSKEKLKALWECLVHDKVFRFFLRALLQEFPLLPTMSGCLYSTTNTDIVPVYPPDHCESELSIAELDDTPDSIVQSTYEILSKFGMPFLDTSLLHGASLHVCPTLNDVPVILRFLCHLNATVELVFTKEEVRILINYFKAIDFKNDIEGCDLKIKTLPLFENVYGTFVSAKDYERTLIWKTKTCSIGYKKWCDVVFIKAKADWNLLGTAKQLHIRKLSAEEVYSHYILPKFYKLNKHERYAHLRHIKDQLMDDCKRVLIDDQAMHNWAIPQRFLLDLKSCKCIEHDRTGILKPVSQYCDHTKEVFQVFRSDFNFLPEFFIEDPAEEVSWLSFFKDIGLKSSLSTEEYLKLCRKVQHDIDKKRSSRVLVEYLFSDEIQKKKWCDNVHFLNDLRCIPFLYTAEQPNLYTWILPCAGDDNTPDLTKPYQAAFVDTSVLLWTIKTPVSFPGYTPHEENKKMVEHLAITTFPTATDVIKNVTNIAQKSKFNSLKLFDKYPIKPESESVSLMYIMMEHFMFLKSAYHSEQITNAQLEQLASLSCIPVYNTPQIPSEWRMVLVYPHSVISSGGSEVEHFHPFLHKLPLKLGPVSDFLAKIGVSEKLKAKHMQILLEKVYMLSHGDPLDENTKKCVTEAVKCLYKLLKSEQLEQPLLEQLYLPTANGTIDLSTKLVYPDNPNFRTNLKLNLKEAKYDELCIHSADYSFTDTNFCAVLPVELRPIGLSKICTMSVASSSKAVEDSALAERLKITLNLKVISKGCLSVVRGITQRESIYKSLERKFINFLCSMKVVTVQELTTSVILSSTGECIGEASVPCFLQTSETTSTLYIDMELEFTEEEPVQMVLDHLMLMIEEERVSDNHLRRIEKILGSVLKAQNGDAIKRILDKESIDLDGIVMEEVNFVIGSDIPQCWKHRLDQDPNNVLYSGEKIGYEVSPDRFIFAEILDPVLPEGFNDFETVPLLEMRFTILIDVGKINKLKIVSALELYKFLRSSQTDNPALTSMDDSPMTALLLHGAGNQADKKARIEENKQKLAKQLDKIWKLSGEKRQKAIKRLYLKWHPDKNSADVEVAEEIFKFLTAEIERREKTPLDIRNKWEQEAKHYHFYRHFERQSRAGASAIAQPVFDRTEFQIKKNQIEAKRWFQQAEADYHTLKVVHEALQNTPTSACSVCFLAHQVAEKALKAGKYHVCGLTENAHQVSNLLSHTYGLQHKLPQHTSGLTQLASPLNDYFEKTRYPDIFAEKIPAELFTCEEASVAVKNAGEILKIVRGVLSVVT